MKRKGEKRLLVYGFSFQVDLHLGGNEATKDTIFKCITFADNPNHPFGQ